MGDPLTYRDAGVDIDATDSAKESLKLLARGAQGPEVLTGIGAFGGLFRPNFQGLSQPVLVGSADGVGTKVMISRAAGRFRSLGLDIVNHCVNDIGAMGALPLFFLDYIAFGKFSRDVLLELVGGIAEACRASNCSLLGGETAEMPDLYRHGDFDIAGFIVGMVDQDRIIDGSTIQAGDSLIGVWSDGLHTNGYSLVRKLFFAQNFNRLDEYSPDLGKTLGEAVLQPHLSYFPLFTALRGKLVKGIAHITGGGIPGNLTRILPNGVGATIRKASWEIPPLFQIIQRDGGIDELEMFRVFNMGVGLILAVDRELESGTLALISETGFGGAVIGSLVPGEREVSIV